MWFKKQRPILAAQSTPAQGNFTLQAVLAGQSGRSIAVQAYIFDGESAESLNARMDLLQEVIERQRIRCEIPELEAKRDQMVKGLEQAKEVLGALVDKERNGEKLSSNEKLQIRNMQTNIGRVSDEIDKGTEAIQEARRKAGVAG